MTTPAHSPNPATPHPAWVRLPIEPGSLTARMPSYSRRLVGFLVVTAVIASLVVLGGWAEGTLAAIYLLLAEPTPPGAFNPDAATTSLIRALVTILASILLLLLFGRLTGHTPQQLGVTAPPASWRRGVTVWAIALLTMASTIKLGELLQRIPGVPDVRHFPWTSTLSPRDDILRAANTTLSGASEELALLAVPVILLRSINTPWWAIYLVTLALRLPFHLYYGPTMLAGLILWTLTFTTLFIATGRFWPLFLAHATHNLLASTLAAAHQDGHDLTYTLLNLALWTLRAAAVLWLLIALLRSPSSRPTAPRATN